MYAQDKSVEVPGVKDEDAAEAVPSSHVTRTISAGSPSGSRDRLHIYSTEFVPCEVEAAGENDSNEPDPDDSRSSGERTGRHSESVRQEGEAGDWEETPFDGFPGDDLQGLHAGEPEAEINTDSLEEPSLEQIWVDAIQSSWKEFLACRHSKEAAGEAVYAALFDSAPNLQSLFSTPRAVQAMRFAESVNNIVQSIHDPPALKTLAESLGFNHLHLDVTVPRVVIFRDAILDLFQVDLGERFSTVAYNAWRTTLNYFGGALIFVRTHYAERLLILAESWKTANDQSSNQRRFAGRGHPEGTTHHGVVRASSPRGKSPHASKHNGHDGSNGGGKSPAASEAGSTSGTKSPSAWASSKSPGKRKKSKSKHEDSHSDAEGKMAQQVPTTYKEMFNFNAAVMGFGTSLWMNEILDCFDNIVTNASNAGRFGEECEVLVLRISRLTSRVNLAEYKSCMLASLRSLLPQDWSTQHEVAWSWLWENVARKLYATLGKPPAWQKALAKWIGSLDETAAHEFRSAIYTKFFSVAPHGQDYFKQSNTYLHLIASKVLAMTLDMYREPVRMTDDISALGLRHVGYGIPTELFAPFASSCIEVLSGLTQDQTCVESFRWSIGLIVKSLVRTILEGSTVVMKAINTNSRKRMTKAMSCAPRGERAEWLLKVQVGTQSISPLSWALESGALQAASAMINDLVTIRADRDRYYYGEPELFARHDDIVKKLIENAPSLLPDLLSGLIWRSRLTFHGSRRVNYYIGNLIRDQQGNFHKTLRWINRFGDPDIACHPTVVLMTDLIWRRIANRVFLAKKSYFLFTLVVFVVSQGVLPHLHHGELDDRGYQKATDMERMATVVCRLLIYVCGLGHLVLSQGKKIYTSYRARDTFSLYNNWIRLPGYLTNWQDQVGLALAVSLVVMLASEPILYCLEEDDGVRFTARCAASDSIIKLPYSSFSMVSALLYFALLTDLVVLHNRVTAYILVCGRMLSELTLFLTLGVSAMVMFSSALSCLFQHVHIFHGIPSGLRASFELFLGVFADSEYALFKEEPLILVMCWAMFICVVLFLGNMLVAQLSCAYSGVYNDMVGYARLKRIGIITESMRTVHEHRWKRFVESLNLDKKLEFNEGDVGLANGIATIEPASAHPTTVDRIRRYGGSTLSSMQWPEDKDSGDSDKIESIEKMIHRALAKTSKSANKRRGESYTSGGSRSESADSQAESDG